MRAVLVCWVVGVLASGVVTAAEPKPAVVGHRGLLKDAPENTLAAFEACLRLRLGFELDIRRTRDGILVCLHDADLDRTTDGKGKLSTLTLAECRKFDAGTRFDPAFANERIPTLDEVFALVARTESAALIALDLKETDETMEADIVRLARRHGVLKRVLCIGRTITEPTVRKKLLAADPTTPTARLVENADGIELALAETDATWLYVRFLPTPDQVAAIHRGKKRVFVAGPLVAPRDQASWERFRAAGVDAILTDYPVECSRTLRGTRP